MSRVPRSLRVIGVLVALTAVVTAGAPSVVRVRTGDTLSALAARHHTTVRELQRLNRLSDDTIYAGALLRLPGSARPAAARPTTRTALRTYTVRPGDNLTVLARRFHTTPAALKAHNRLRRDTIVIGQRLTYATVVRTAAAPTAVPGTVSASAAAHRTLLRSRAVPSKAAVRTMIRKAAKRHGVPASLALALAYQESGFQQRVVSPVDAIGVMQVLPSTGRSLGRLHGRRYDLLTASGNVEAGVTLLRDLLRATGSVPGALAGYYQGLGSVRAKGLLPQTHQYIRNVTLLQRRFR